MIDLLIEGLSAMVIGMGTVLLFLCLMIFSMFIMSKAVKRLNVIFPEAVPQGVNVKKAVASDDSEIAAAVVAALFSKK